MTLKWMKEHSTQLVVGAIVIVILLLFAFPSVFENKPAVKSPTCVGESCAVGGDGKSDEASSGSSSSGATTSGMKSEPKKKNPVVERGTAMVESVKQMLKR